MAVVAGKTESRTARFRAGPRHGTSQGPGRRRPRRPSAGEEGEPPLGCVSAGRRQSRSLRQQSYPARFVARAGNLWHASTHTEGARCSAGGHWHGIPSAQGASSRLARRQGVKKPLMTEARHSDQGNGDGRDSWSNDLLALPPDGGQTGHAHRCRRTRTLWSPARCGTFALPPVKWPARQGEARIRTP